MGQLQEFMIDEQHHVFIFYGPMRSGKTSSAVNNLMELEKHSPWKDHIIAFRPENDTRKTSESSSGIGFDSLPHFHWANGANPTDDVFNTLRKEYGIQRNNKYNRKFIVAFDEVTIFGPSILDIILRLGDMKVKVVTCGLNLDYRQNSFNNIATLLTLVPEKCKRELSSCCEYVKKGEMCEFPGRYTQREILEGDIWKPSSFFEATVIPEGEVNDNYRYSVVCREHHRVRHYPLDAHAYHDVYEKQFQELDKYFNADSHMYPVLQKKFIKEARQRSGFKK